MDSFHQQLEDLIPYFSAVAQISGGLLGLVFVALTFNPNTLALRHDIALRSLAQQIFADFLMVMVISLLLLIPNTQISQVSLVLAVIAMVGIARLLLSVGVLRRAATASRSRLLQRFGLSLLGHVGILIAGVLLGIGGDNASAAWLTLLMSPLALLIAGSRSAWWLVTQSAE